MGRQEWDERNGTGDRASWSGRVDGTLARQGADRTPSMALDAAAGRRVGARRTRRLVRVSLVCLLLTLVAACRDPTGWDQTIPPDVEAFSPSVVGIIAEEGGPSDRVRAWWDLVGGGRVEFTDTTRTLLGGRSSAGNLLAAGTDGTGPWVAFAEHVPGSDPDCFSSSAIVLDDGDAVVLDGYRFMKAPDFTTPFPSTKRGARYPRGTMCFDAQFQVISVGQ